MDLLEAVAQQIPQKLASFVSLVLDEMFVKEGFILTNTQECLS